MYDGDVKSRDAGARVVSPDVDLRIAEIGCHPIGAAFDRSGEVAAIAGGDGTIRLIPRACAEVADAAFLQCFAGATLALAADGEAGTFLAGGDDGMLRRIGRGGEVAVLDRFPGSWVETLSCHRDSGTIAVSAGRTVHILEAGGKRLHSFDDHPSTPTGLSFAPDGGSIAVSRYNGISIWSLDGHGHAPRDLFWRGSHTGVAWSPDGRFIVSSTQDREMHCWAPETKTDMRMSGYPGKIRTMSWTADSCFLAASGADTVTAWSFEGAGPAGKPPLEFGYVFNGTVTHVEAHPTRRIVAGGFNDGTILIGDIVKGDSLIAKPPGGGAVTCQAWSGDGKRLIAGTDGGLLAVMDITGDP